MPTLACAACPSCRALDSLAFAIRDYEAKGEKKSRWLEIGAAWAHKDGKGFDIALEAVPVDGRIALRRNELSKAVR